MELELINLKKTYGTVQALKGINYKFTSGIYGILGSNGAGKSTMINLITDNISRDKINGGSILYSQDKEKKDILKLGKNFRKIVGYMPQQQGFYEDFSPMAFLKYMAEIKEVKKIKVSDKNGNTITKSVNQQIEELLDVVNLSNVAYKKIGGFSGGMKQRVLLAQALLGEPRILILDEPTAGLDPKERISIRNYIAELSKNKIILFATHVVSDIECIADKVILLKDGQIIATGTPVELIENMSGKVVPIEEVKDEVFSSKALGDGLAIEPEENVIVAPCDATVSVLMEGSRHAVGLTLANGVEILIHEGIDTVNMEGDGFEYFVKEGDKVNAGDKLLSFDPEKIKAHGYEKTCILVVTNGDDYPDMKLHTGMDAVQGETVIAEF